MSENTGRGQRLARIRRDNKTGFRGVIVHRGKYWFKLNDTETGVRHSDGPFNTARQAAIAYDRLAHKVWSVRPNKRLGLL